MQMKKFENDPTLSQLKSILNRFETETLSPLATRNEMGTRRTPVNEPETDYRQAFSVDADRILHSLARCSIW